MTVHTIDIVADEMEMHETEDGEEFITLIFKVHLRQNGQLLQKMMVNTDKSKEKDMITATLNINTDNLTPFSNDAIMVRGNWTKH